MINCNASKKESDIHVLNWNSARRCYYLREVYITVL